MTQLSSELLHASSVSVGGRAVLIEGRSGSGKSDLALRLIDRGAVLISDDYTLVKREKTRLIATTAPNIGGKIEVRGVGLVEMPCESEIPVGLVVRLGHEAERLPEPGEKRRIAGVDVPAMALIAFEASAPIKVELALRNAGNE